MDPLLFSVDGQQTAEALGAVVLLSIFIERALALLFEHRFFVAKFSQKGVKEPIALIVSFLVVKWLDFDALAIIFKTEETSFWGFLLTALVVAGGSKGSAKLFRDWLKIKSSAAKEEDEKATA